MISLYSDGGYYQYLYHEETGTYLYIAKDYEKCEEGICSINAFGGYRENDWSDFEDYWDSPQELIEFVERHMKHD